MEPLLDDKSVNTYHCTFHEYPNEFQTVHIKWQILLGLMFFGLFVFVFWGGHWIKWDEEKKKHPVQSTLSNSVKTQSNVDERLWINNKDNTFFSPTYPIINSGSLERVLFQRKRPVFQPIWHENEYEVDQTATHECIWVYTEARVDSVETFNIFCLVDSSWSWTKLFTYDGMSILHQVL